MLGFHQNNHQEESVKKPEKILADDSVMPEGIWEFDPNQSDFEDDIPFQ